MSTTVAIVAWAWPGPGLRVWPWVIAAGAGWGIALAVGRPDAVRRDLEASWVGVERASVGLAIVAACIFVAVAWRWNTQAAGGSDSHCYAGQAEMFARGMATIDQPLAHVAPWPHAIDTLLPAGFVASPARPTAVMPICPPGLSLMMAAALLVGGRLALFLTVPLFGAVLVVATFAIGRTMWNGRVGLIAAILTAASPIVLYQVVQPMSDVPAAALWTTAIALALRGNRHSPWLAGLATAAAIATRPNLAPLAAPIAFLMTRGDSWPVAIQVRRVATYAAAVLPGPVIVACLNAAMTGSPFRSGYGALDLLYRLEHIPINAARYPVWLVEAHTPFILLALLAPFGFVSKPLAQSPTGKLEKTQSPQSPKPNQPPPRLRRSAEASRKQIAKAEAQSPSTALGAGPTFFAMWALAFTALVLAAYLPFTPYPEWWYLRFLMPGLPLLVLLATATAVAIIDRLPVSLRVLATLALVGWLVPTWVNGARTRHAFELQTIERRFIEAGRYIARATPPEAVVFTVSESGSVRFYAGRQTVAWDVMEPAWLDRAIAFFVDQGKPVYVLLEEAEEPLFRARFEGASSYGTLDWPPNADIRTHVRVRVWDIADRERYLHGTSVKPQIVWPAR